MNTRLYDIMLDEVEKEWGRTGWENLGDRLQRALPAERIVLLCTTQDESMLPSTVRFEPTVFVKIDVP